jgi:hypothetical protein
LINIEGFKREAREFVLRARLYRILAIVTAVIGLIIFIILYNRNIGGRFEQAITEPQTIAVILLPFLPSFFMSFMASRARKKLTLLLKKIENANQSAKAK